MPENAMELSSKTAWQKDDLKKFIDLEESAMHDPSCTTLPRVLCGHSQFQKTFGDFLLEKAMLSRLFSILDSSSSCPPGLGNLHEGRSSRHQGLLLFTHGSMGASGSPHKYYLVHWIVWCGNLRTQLWLKHKPRCEVLMIRGRMSTMDSNHTTRKQITGSQSRAQHLPNRISISSYAMLPSLSLYLRSGRYDTDSTNVPPVNSQFSTAFGSQSRGQHTSGCPRWIHVFFQPNGLSFEPEKKIIVKSWLSSLRVRGGGCSWFTISWPWTDSN